MNADGVKNPEIITDRTIQGAQVTRKILRHQGHESTVVARPVALDQLAQGRQGQSLSIFSADLEIKAVHGFIAAFAGGGKRTNAKPIDVLVLRLEFEGKQALLIERDFDPVLPPIQGRFDIAYLPLLNFHPATDLHPAIVQFILAQRQAAIDAQGIHSVEQQIGENGFVAIRTEAPPLSMCC